MNANFKEKSAWLSAIAILVIFGNYFGRVWFFPGEDGDSASLLVTVVVIFIILEIVLHIGLALGHPRENADERDTDVAGKSYRNAYYIVMIGVFYTLGGILFAQPLALMTTTNMLVLSIVLGELVNFGSQIFYYRNGT